MAHKPAIIHLSQGKRIRKPNDMTLRSKPDCRLHDQNNPLLDSKRLTAHRVAIDGLYFWREERRRKQEGKRTRNPSSLEKLIASPPDGGGKRSTFRLR